MTKIKIYNLSTSSTDEGGNEKGSISNPFTVAEYEALLNAGDWKGGFVEGLGFCLPQVVVTPSGASFPSGVSYYDSWTFSDSSYDSWGYDGDNGNNNGSNTGGGQGDNNHNDNGDSDSNSPYPQINETQEGIALLYKGTSGIGMQSTFLYKYTIRIIGYTMFVSVSVSSVNFNSRNFWATAVLQGNGNKKFHFPLSRDRHDTLSETGWTLVGNVYIELPKSGNATAWLYIGYNHDSGAGYVNDSTELRIYPQ